MMTADEYAAEVRRLAEAEGVRAVEGYWDADEWEGDMLDGLTPAQAWAEERAARDASNPLCSGSSVQS